MDTRAVLLVVLFLALLAGCSSSRRGSRDASAHASAGPAGVQVAQSGAAAVPAKATRTASHVATWIPAGVEVTAWLDGRVTWKTSADAPFVFQTTAETATGPQSFTPPAAPSPGDEADGKARFWAWVWIAVGAVAAGFGFTQGWRLVGIGGACVAAAGVCVIALSSVPGWVWGLGGVGVLVAVFGWAYWTFYLSRRTAPAPKKTRADLAALEPARAAGA